MNVLPMLHVTPMPPPSAPSEHQDEQHAPRVSHAHSASIASLSPEALAALEDQGYSRGLIEAMIQNQRAFPVAFWIIDNSGSMSTPDGHRLVPTKRRSEVKVISATRWKELQETVEYHAEMAALLRRTTHFRLLNDPGRAIGPQEFSVAEHAVEAYIREDLAVVRSTMEHASPSGVTPLTYHLQQVLGKVRNMKDSLTRDGTKVAIIICSDGVPTDDLGNTSTSIRREFTNTLRAFQGLPVWLVVRLCTDEEPVVQFWNELDDELELSLEVLDDFIAEAAEVYQHNPWLNYALPVHRMREFGFHSKLFDLLDERSLTKDEVKDFCRMLFGVKAMEKVPDPELDFKDFIAQLSLLNVGEQWNTVTKKIEPWINMRNLKRAFGTGSWFSLW